MTYRPATHDYESGWCGLEAESMAPRSDGSKAEVEGNENLAGGGTMSDTGKHNSLRPLKDTSTVYINKFCKECFERTFIKPLIERPPLNLNWQSCNLMYFWTAYTCLYHVITV